MLFHTFLKLEPSPCSNMSLGDKDFIMLVWPVSIFDKSSNTYVHEIFHDLKYGSILPYHEDLPCR